MTFPIRKTKKGQVQGINVDGTDKFLGIPYAKPPVGELRFLPPVENLPWEGTYQATAFKNSPMAVPDPEEGNQYPPEGKTTEMSEDCLYLNVYAPENAQNEKLPVMVWLYGGHYMNGTSMKMSTDGSNFVRKQNVILVTFNYRLGIFGFMAHPSLKKKAEHYTNAGLGDMIMTLKWIRDNIANFGGNPDNVTIFGVSAGSSAINVLMTSPEAKGLFHAAITQSGSPFNHDEWDVGEVQEEERCQKYLTSVNVKEEELQTVSVEKLLSNPAGYFAGEFCPYVDGDLVPDRLERSYLKGNIHDIPVILGCTADEAFILLGERDKVTKERFDRTVNTKYPHGRDYIYAKYGAYLNQAPAYALGRFRSDNTIANMRYFATCLSKHRQSPTYYYVFTRVEPSHDPAFFGAHHSSETPYIFQNLDNPAIDYDDFDQKVSDNIATYWANFARNHHPNDGKLPEWKPFTAESDLTMYIDEPCECVPLKTKAMTDELQKILSKRTEENNPGLKV